MRQLKADSDLALSVDGPHWAAQAIRAGLVGEYQLFVGPAIVGSGNPFFPDDVRVDLEWRAVNAAWLPWSACGIIRAG